MVGELPLDPRQGLLLHGATVALGTAAVVLAHGSMRLRAHQRGHAALHCGLLAVACAMVAAGLALSPRSLAPLAALLRITGAAALLLVCFGIGEAMRPPRVGLRPAAVVAALAATGLLALIPSPLPGSMVAWIAPAVAARVGIDWHCATTAIRERRRGAALAFALGCLLATVALMAWLRDDLEQGYAECIRRLGDSERCELERLAGRDGDDPGRRMATASRPPSAIPQRSGGGASAAPGSAAAERVGGARSGGAGAGVSGAGGGGSGGASPALGSGAGEGVGDSRSDGGGGGSGGPSPALGSGVGEGVGDSRSAAGGAGGGSSGAGGNGGAPAAPGGSPRGGRAGAGTPHPGSEASQEGHPLRSLGDAAVERAVGEVPDPRDAVSRPAGRPVASVGVLDALAGAAVPLPELVSIGGPSAVASPDPGTGPRPIPRGSLPIPLAGRARDLELRDDLVFVAGWTSGLLVARERDGEVFPIAHLETPGIAAGVALAGYHVVLADYSTLRVVDVSRPSQPRSVGALGLAGVVLDVEVVGSRAFVAAWQAGLHVVDLSDPTAPALLATLPLGGYASDVEVLGGHAYVAAGVAGCAIVDITSQAPRVEFVVPVTGGARGVGVAGHLLWLAGYGSGIHVYDVSRPASPVPVAHHAEPASALDVELDGVTALVSAGRLGVWVIEPTRPGPARWLATQLHSSATLAARRRGARLYLANDHSGVVSYELRTREDGGLVID